MLQTWHRVLIAPKSQKERHRRQEFILNVLLVSVILLATCAFLALVAEALAGRRTDGNTPLAFMAGVSIFFMLLLFAARTFAYRSVSYLFVASFFALATMPVYQWGTLLPQGILTYAVVVVLAGVLTGTVGAITVAAAAFVVLAGLTYLTNTGVVTPDLLWMEQPGRYVDTVAYGLTFLVLALIVWLSNSEIKRSMRQARESGEALKRERDLLEVKVQQRTAELQKAQVENMRELQRFAEFGRHTATLLHDLASPLTAISLNLEQLGSQRSALVKRAREGLDYIEHYIAAARRQLSNQRETKSFDAAKEIRRVGLFLSGKAAQQHVRFDFNMDKGVRLYADSIRFSQAIANLLANALDAYQDVTRADKVVEVVLDRRGAHAVIVVRDYGKGISPEDMRYLFEPFFTTKPVGRGLGIGLATVKQTVEDDFGGRITVASGPRKGTVFTVELPLP